MTRPTAAQAGTVTLGGAITVNRLGFGAMRLTGVGVWGPPKDRKECSRVLRRALELGVTSTRPTRMAPMCTKSHRCIRTISSGLVIATKVATSVRVRFGGENGQPDHPRRL
jgi:predicted aldo/keto reductase-like oxidoreductase